MEFNTFKISDIADVQTGPFGSQLHKEDYVAVGTPIITVEHLGENKIIHSNLPKVKREDWQRLSKYVLKENDIVFSRVGSVDRCALVSEKENNWLFSGRCLRVRVKDTTKVAPKYLSYYFSSKKFKSYIRSIAVGATMPSINTKILSEIKIKLPDIFSQRKISKLLYQLDSKIWCNEQLIKKLEQIAQTLFKHWFIDFEFPNEEGKPYKSSGGEMVESELGEIPRKWNVLEVSDFANGNIITGKTPSTKQKENYDLQGIPFITIPDMHDIVYSIKTSKYISEIGVQTQVKKMIPKNSICVSCIATPGLVCITSRDSLFNQQINSFTPLLEELYYLFFSFKKLSNYIKELGSSGSTTLNLNKTQFSKIKIIRPQQNILESFNEIIKPIFEMILTLSTENINLQQLRDTLLPKLLSGEIEIPDDLEV